MRPAQSSLAHSVRTPDALTSAHFSLISSLFLRPHWSTRVFLALRGILEFLDLFHVSYNFSLIFFLLQVFFSGPSGKLYLPYRFVYFSAPFHQMFTLATVFLISKNFPLSDCPFLLALVLCASSIGANTDKAA